MTIDHHTQSHDQPNHELISAQEPDHETIDPSLFVNLLTQLGQLIINSGHSNDPETRTTIANQATSLRSSLVQANHQLSCLPAGDLSLEDQESLIDQLEQRLDLEMSLLRYVNEAPNSLGSSNTPAPSTTRQQTSSPAHVFDHDSTMPLGNGSST